MRFDGQDSGSADREPPLETPLSTPLDAAESSWDPWLWALYLREVAGERRPVLH